MDRAYHTRAGELERVVERAGKRREKLKRAWEEPGKVEKRVGERTGHEILHSGSAFSS